MENLIKLLDVIIWPCVVLFAGYIFRKPIKDLLPFLKSIIFKDFQIHFHKGIDQIKDELEEAGIEHKIEINEKTEIYKLIEASPSSAIIESWNKLEDAARRKVKELAPRKTTFKNILQDPIGYLAFTGALIPPTVRAIRGLRYLYIKNKTAFAPDLNISKADAIEYVSLSKAILRQIEIISHLPKFKLTALTLLISELNHLIDSGKYNTITIEDVRNVIEEKRIIPFLVDTMKDDADFSMYGTEGPYEDFVEYYHERMYQIYNGYAGNERRKWGVENIGLCLLLAWTNEIVQQGGGWHPNEQ